MDYHKADDHVAEAYILGDLTKEESAAFEEHFFGCSACADEVRDTVKIAAGVRSMRREFTPTNYVTRWALAASVVIATGLGYLYLAHRVQPPPTQSSPIAAAEQSIELDSSRGASDVHNVRADQPVALYFVIPPPEHPLALYTCELLDAAAVKILTKSVTQAEALNMVKMALKPRMLRSGQYKVVIRGGDREIAAYPFIVEVH